MPTEAQLKAQMQAAIAAKKKQTSEATNNDTSSEVTQVAPVKEGPAPTPPAPKPTPEPTPEPTPTPPTQEPILDKPVSSPPTATEPTTPQTPFSLTFYGHAIRLTTNKQEVYFSLDDILPLSNNHEAQMRYIEFKNQPSTRVKAESLIKTMVFTNENGTEKLDGAKAVHVIEILRELKLSSPGPLGRWLNEISTQYQPATESKG